MVRVGEIFSEQCPPRWEPTGHSWQSGQDWGAAIKKIQNIIE